MKIVFNMTLLILVLLAISSGVTKTMLMPADVEFFGRFGFSHPILISFGVGQLVGGILLVPLKFRVAGAIIVAISFLISLALLVMAGDYAVAAITLICIVLLGWVIKNSMNVSLEQHSNTR